MKNLDKKKIFISVIIIVLILLLITLGLLFCGGEKIDLSSYPDGTKVITNRKLKAEKCIDDICISDLHIFYVEENGTVEFMLENKKDVKTSGYYKIILGKEELIVYYDFDGKEKYKSEAGYDGIDLSKATDYKFVKITKEDEKRIVK